MLTIDKMNKKHQCLVVRCGAQEMRKYKLKQEKLSQSFTTDINQVIEIKV
jgi:hypothetical protein